MNLRRPSYRPEQLWLIAGAAVALLVVLAAALWVAGVHQRAAARLADIGPRHARLAGMLQDGERLAQAQKGLQANLTQYVHPADADAGQVGNGVLQRVRELATAEGLRVTSSQVAAPQEDRDSPAFDRLGVNLRVEGEWPQVQALLKALPAQRPAVYISTVLLQSQPGRGMGQPPMQVHLDLFVLKERKP